MKTLETERLKIQNRILRNCSSRAYGLAVMKQIDEYAKHCVEVALSDEACKTADEVGI